MNNLFHQQHLAMSLSDKDPYGWRSTQTHVDPSPLPLHHLLTQPEPQSCPLSTSKVVFSTLLSSVKERVCHIDSLFALA